MTMNVEIIGEYKAVVSGPGNFIVSANTNLSYRIELTKPEETEGGHIWEAGHPAMHVALLVGQSLFAKGKGACYITEIENPVQVIETPEERATRSNRAFLASTSGVDVGRNDVLFMTLSNPANSGKNLVLKRRIFGTNQRYNQTPLEYIAYGNPKREASKELVTPSLIFGGEQSVMTAAYDVFRKGTEIGGFQGSAEVMPVGGVVRSREFETIMPPGNTFGFLIGGKGGTVGINARVYATLEWYEELLK